jgi:hypothetical protein
MTCGSQGRDSDCEAKDGRETLRLVDQVELVIETQMVQFYNRPVGSIQERPDSSVLMKTYASTYRFMDLSR